jgi:hypothetical protein
MAIARKKTTASRRKKTGGTKKKKARTAASVTVKLVIAGQNFTKSSCHGTKTDAKKRAENVRKTGSRARVLKSGKSYCVYTGGKSKVLARRRA